MAYKHNPPLSPFYLEHESDEMRRRRHAFERFMTTFKRALAGGSSPAEEAYAYQKALLASKGSQG